ncbi:MAG: tRNA (adenosine(37)-N6)-threonylcarbamoyltransferase complex ATPase subunit type 1 TsaE [Gemmatimonadota bacterium]
MRVTEEELGRWGERIGASTEPPLTLALVGPLGAGKSVLARAIGRGAGVVDVMPSPSYNILFRYAAGLEHEVVHLDLYRVASVDELWELGWSALGAATEIVLIEWPERAEGAMPYDYWVVELSLVEGEPSLRDVSVERVGAPPELAGFPVALS